MARNDPGLERCQSTVGCRELSGGCGLLLDENIVRLSKVLMKRLIPAGEEGGIGMLDETKLHRRINRRGRGLKLPD